MATQTCKEDFVRQVDNKENWQETEFEPGSEQRHELKIEED